MRNFTQEFFIVWPHDCLCKISKIFAEFNKVFNFEKSLIYALPKFNWNLMSLIETLWVLVVIYISQ